MSRYVLWLLSMLGTMIGLALLSGVLIGLMIASPRAQQPNQRPGTGPNCMDLGTTKADAQFARIMLDSEGEWWILLRFTSTGRQLIGFISRQSGMFCATGEGKVNPES